MPFNGSGTFTRLRNWVSDAAGGIKIRADYHDQEDDGFAAGLSNCIARDGQSVVTANIPFNAKRLTNVADPVNDQDAMTKKWGQTNLISGAHVADTPPAAAQAGNLWWDSNEGNLYLKYDDGTSTQWVQVNVSPQAIVPPPSDGNEYAMINGVWQLKSQTFDLAGLSQRDVPVPAWGPSRMRMDFRAYASATTPATAAYLRLSLDGTTFPSGAADYTTAGFMHHTGSTGFATVARASSSGMGISGGGDNANIPIAGTVDLNLTRGVNAHLFNALSRGLVYLNNPAGLNMNAFYNSETGTAAFPGTGPVKAIRWYLFPTQTVAFGNLSVEWLL